MNDRIRTYRQLRDALNRLPDDDQRLEDTIAVWLDDSNEYFNGGLLTEHDSGGILDETHIVIQALGA